MVNKTASPDLPGEFTGGLIQINTKDVPAKNLLEVTVGTGFNTARWMANLEEGFELLSASSLNFAFITQIS